MPDDSNSDNTVPVSLDHGGKLLQRFKPLPAQLRFPVLKELSRPGRVAVVPELPERLFEHIGLVEPFVCLEQHL